MVDLSASLESQSGGETLSSVLNACMVDASLITLNLTQQLEFADLITFPNELDSNEINAAFDLGGLDSMLTESSMVNISSFWRDDGYTGFDEWAVVDANLAAMSALPTKAVGGGAPIVYKRSDVLTNYSTAHDPTGHYATNYDSLPDDHLMISQIRALQKTVCEGIEIAVALQGAVHVAAIRADVALISSNITDLREHLVSVVDSVATDDDSMRRLIDPVFEAVNGFRAASYC